MQDLTSLNFEPLRSVWPELANMGGYAEHYAHSDPESSLVKLRNFAERVVDHIYVKLKLQRAPQSNFIDLLNNASFQMVATDLPLDKLHLIRKLGNRAAHGEGVQAEDAVRCVREAWQLARWLHVTFLAGQPDDFSDFKIPPAEGIDNKAEVKRKVKALAIENNLKEERLRQALQELADLRAADKTPSETEPPKEPSPDEAELRRTAQSAAKAAQQLRFSEDNTRKWLIDRDLRMAGWDVSAGLASNESVGQEVEVLHQPTTTTKGYCDYVLWDDNGKPLAVVEAKKTSVDARVGQEQARLYADGLEKMHGQRPMIFFTNGHDIWVWDDVAGYPPRYVYGFYSKDTLQYRVSFQRKERLDLLQTRPDPLIAGRMYQIEGITRVAERFTQRHRKALVVQATGTGKTRVAISLTKLLIEARWVKRVLFLCDRKELRKQAKNAFNDFLKEPLYVIGQQNDIGKLDARVYIGIYQGLINDYESFDVGFFDLIIADESHRSVYNLYGDLFKYFDALQVGLTATPVEMVSRSTCQLFGCDYKLPTANYPLEQAIADHNLVPFRVVAHTTKFLRDGIKAAHLTDEQIAELEDQGIDPNTLEFDAQEIDDAVFNKDTNRVILRNLMDNGIRDADGQLPGKSIVFARNINHARLLAELFDEMYPQFAGKFCRVIHSQEPRAEELIDDFKGKLDPRIAISVDMLDTGIDVPEVVNLVFAKPVKSKVKFWQMIGRGTRLCKDLFGAGKDKSEFLIFDHWGNFAYHDLDVEEVEPKVPKPLTQRRYEARIELATLALAKSEIAAFDALAIQIQQDALALPDRGISVREHWQAVQQARDPKLVHQFAPVTRQLLLDTVAPLMNALDVRGQGEALRWDLLLGKAQAAAISDSAAANPCRLEIQQWVDRLPPHLNPVRAKAAELIALHSDAFWLQPTFAQLDAMREALRSVIHFAEAPVGLAPSLVTRLDIHEDAGDYHIEERPTKIKSVDFGIYRKAVQSALEPLFDTDPVLQKIRRGEPVSLDELDSLNSLLHTRNPNVDLATLREFFPETAVPMASILRSIVGHDHKAVEERFTVFAQAHALSSTQLRFLSLLKENIRQYGALSLGQLFEAPFTTIHSEGLGGVFPNEHQLDQIVQLVRSFGEPLNPSPAS
ncbi:MULTISPECIES: DEAD/DEAH box helicase family protein [unclassified Polaromonas]|nr:MULTISPECIES: DEAD/DEAH box helicase family protein [unclassified Polaromonas]OYZ19510.1 MAG: DEAD/DEAH box helicase [Polaromonas sp. 16-63-31]OYY34838.1 MAG: DEAD/DEAH box helicase [Polaromonas sp. 35-63-35]OYZ77591.1 MAG: DEAD/DEAH box helicase [Polaromonas sp. 24-63-21]OZA48554.1 MAG: DEAD/DEAH box helicase [Polaromonas sp. 17-63-33]OZA87307.1 MAG: DEAD/DEAH box helicase [Polaromonas sp. 39-63-25]